MTPTLCSYFIALALLVLLMMVRKELGPFSQLSNGGKWMLTGALDQPTGQRLSCRRQGGVLVAVALVIGEVVGTPLAANDLAME